MRLRTPIGPIGRGVLTVALVSATLLAIALGASRVLAQFGLPPVIVRFTPTHGVVGTKVTISGAGFATTSNVAFNKANAKFKVVSDTELQAEVPAGAVTGKISVTNAGGTVSTVTDFVVVALLAVDPQSGPVGMPVTITGTGFTYVSRVEFTGSALPFVEAAFTVLSDKEIHTSVPAGAASGPIRLTTAAGSMITSLASFSVAPMPPQPTIESFVPQTGPPGTLVAISGASFTFAYHVDFNGTPALHTVISDTKIEASVPVGATTGRIHVTSPAGTGTSVTPFTVIGDIGSQVLYSIRTVMRKDGKDLPPKTTDAVAGTFVPIDVNEDTVSDIAVQLSGIPAGPLATECTSNVTGTLEVKKLPGAPPAFPLLIEAILKTGKQDEPTETKHARTTFGYDTRQSDAPVNFRLDLKKTDAEKTRRIGGILNVQSPGPSLTVVSSSFEEPSARQRFDPLDIRVEYSPVPPSHPLGSAVLPDVEVDAVGESCWWAKKDDRGEKLEPTDTTVQLRTTKTTKVVARMTTAKGQLAPDAPCTTTCTSAAGTINELTPELGARLNIGKHRRFVDPADVCTQIGKVTVKSQPADNKPGEMRLDSAEIGDSEGGMIQWPTAQEAPPGSDYLKSIEYLKDPNEALDTENDHSVAASIRGLRQIDLSLPQRHPDCKDADGNPAEPKEPIRVSDLDHAKGPFLVLVRKDSVNKGDQLFAAKITADELPANVFNLTYSARKQELAYNGSDGINTVAVDVSDDAPDVTKPCCSGGLFRPNLDDQIKDRDGKPSGEYLDDYAGFRGVVTEVHAAAASVPPQLTVDYSPDPDPIYLCTGVTSTDAEGTRSCAATGNVGRLEVELRGGDPRAADEPAVCSTGCETAQRLLFKDLGTGLGDRWVTFARLVEVSKATVSVGDDIRLSDVGHKPGPFEVKAFMSHIPRGADLSTQPSVVSAVMEIKDLPAVISLHYQPTKQTFSYSGTESIETITADVSDPAGILRQEGIAREVHLLVRDLPTGLVVSWRPDGDPAIDAIPALSIEARNASGELASIGQVELAVNRPLRLPPSPPPEPCDPQDPDPCPPPPDPDDLKDLPPEVDGVIFRDLPLGGEPHGVYEGVARITGLQQLVVVLDETAGPPQASTIDIKLRATGGREVRGNIWKDDPWEGKAVYIRPKLRSLPSELDLRMQTLTSENGEPASTTVTYTASSPVAGPCPRDCAFVVKSNAGHRDSLFMSLNPLPRHFRLCVDPAEVDPFDEHPENVVAVAQCTGSRRFANEGSMSYEASEHAMMDVVDCITRGCVSHFTVIDNLWIRKLEQESQRPLNKEAGKTSGRAFLNTTDNPGQVGEVQHELSGSIRKFVNGRLDKIMNLAPGFKANRRLTQWAEINGPLLPPEVIYAENNITCPIGTEIKTDWPFSAFGLFDITDLICD